MKKCAITSLCVLCLFFLQAQKFDNTWILGYFGGSLGSGLPAMDFRYNYPDTTLFYTPFDFSNTNASICDSNGFLVLFTNGVSVANRYQRIISGSDSFNYDPVMAYYGGASEAGDQCALILPFPGHDSVYYIFHNAFQFLDATNENFAPVNLSYSVVDMHMDNGLGVMTHKGQIAISDTMIEGTMQAVKRANGQDWWVVIHRYNAGTFYAVEFTSQGVGQTVESQTGPVFPANQVGQSLFSPDGTKYVSVMSDDNIRIANFDRCTGQFVYLETLGIPYDSTYGYITGCAISPNSRYLYVNNSGKLFQFDLQATDVANSKIIVGQFDSYGDPAGNEYACEELGPDGKIYISTGNGCKHLHVINNPNHPGTACNFVQHQLEISGYSSRTLPLMPNFRLGATTVSACDSSLSTSVDQTDILQSVLVFPNPTDGRISIKTQSGDFQNIFVFDGIGNLIEKVPFSSELDISALRVGVYFLELEGESSVIRSRIVKM